MSLLRDLSRRLTALERIDGLEEAKEDGKAGGFVSRKVDRFEENPVGLVLDRRLDQERDDEDQGASKRPPDRERSDWCGVSAMVEEGSSS